MTPTDQTDEALPLPVYFERKTADLGAAELRAYEPLAYEVAMLGEVAHLASILPAASDDHKNVLAESFAVHFRNLALFLWQPLPPPSDEKRQTDVLAPHFVPGWGPVPKPTTLDSLIGRVGREVAHLTTHRLPGRHIRKRWNAAECIRALLPALEAFVRKASEADTLPPAVAEGVARLRSMANDATTMRTFETMDLSTTRSSRLQVWNR